MAVLINGIEMPESCDDCLLNNGITCYAVPEYKEDGVVGRTDDRPNWCPLVHAADVRPVVSGKWALCLHGEFACTNCRERTKKRTNFCPNCGADMREEHDEKA